MVGPPTLQAYLFTDLVDSTALKERLGDVVGAEMIERHDIVFRRCLRENGGIEHSNPGDGFFATFPSPSAALRCALAFLDGLSALEGDTKLRARVGLHVGDAVVVGVEGTTIRSKLLGLAVDLAGRIQGLALPNQILMTRAAYDSVIQHVRSVDDEPVEWRCHGLYRMKGAERPVEIFEGGVVGIAPFTPPPGSAKAHRIENETPAPAVADPSTELPAGIPRRLGPYSVERELGRGSMGRVFLARVRSKLPGLEIGQRIALKTFNPQVVEDPDLLARFVLESELGQRVDHENVVRTYLLDSTRGPDGKEITYLALEYVDGVSLRTWLDEMEHVPEELCRHVGREVAKALSAIHEAGVIHRDLKPENVLVTRDHRVKVTDFGVGRLREASSGLTRTNQFIGSFLYAAPEQFRGGRVDERTDLYSLGMVLFELAAKRPPMSGRDPAEIMHWHISRKAPRLSKLNDRISPFLEELVARLLMKTPEDRGASAAELHEILEAGEKSAWWRSRVGAIREETRQPPREMRIPRETAVFGRKGELRKLTGHFDVAAAGEAQVVFLEGETGVGKTRLIDEFVHKLGTDDRGVRFLHGGYQPAGGAATEAFVQAFAGHLGLDRIEQTLSDLLPNTPGLVPALAALFRGDANASVAALKPDAVATALVALTQALAAEGPLIVLIDDLHFTSEDGRRLFSSLAWGIPGHPVFLIGTTRPGLPTEWLAEMTRRSHCHKIELCRLSPAAVTAMLTDALRSRRSAEAVSADVARSSDGNPLFILEMVQGLRDKGVVHRRPDGTWTMAGDRRKLVVPHSVTDIIRGRLRALDDEERSLLEVAACVGFQFDPSIVALAADENLIKVLRMLARLESRRRIVRSMGDGFVFDHHQFQEVLHRDLSAPLATAYHALIGEALEERLAAATESDAKGRLAIDACCQLVAGGKPANAAPHLAAALDALEQALDYRRAQDLAIAVLSADGALVGERRLRITLRAIHLSELVGRTSAVTALLDDAEQLAKDLDEPGFRAELALRRASHKQNSGDPEGAVRDAETALRYAQEAGHSEIEARAITAVAIDHARSGDLKAAGAGFETALALYEELGHIVGRPQASGNLAVVAEKLGDFDRAQELHEVAIRLHREAGNRKDEALEEGNIASLYRELGHYETALVHFEAHLRLAREIGHRLGEAKALGNVGGLLLELGRSKESHTLLKKKFQISLACGYRRSAAFALVSLGRHAEYFGEPDDARTHLRAALKLYEEMQHRARIPGTLLDLGRLALEHRQAHEATAILQRAFDMAESVNDVNSLPVIAAYRAGLPGGTPDKAEELLKRLGKTIGVAHRMEAYFALWQATLDQDTLAKAHRLLLHLCERAPGEDREAMMKKVPLHSRIVQAWTASVGTTT